MRNILFLLMNLLFVFSCSEQKKPNYFVDQEYWLPKDIDWEVAYDDVTFSNGPLIIKGKDSSWRILFPGSLTLKDDTIRVNRENGHPNICRDLGKLKVGQTVNISSSGSERIFKVLNDSVLEFDQKTFIKSNKIILNSDWCDLKE